MRAAAQGARGFGWGDLAALVVSGVAAAVAPLQVFLLAYVLLGPFHYLTEIAWLKKKKFYFGDGLVSPRMYAWLAGGLAVVGAADFVVRHGLSFWVIGALLLLSFSVWVRNLYVLATIAVAGVVAKELSPAVVVLVAVIVPTVVHVFFFTWIFTVSGALRSKGLGWARWVNPVLTLAIPVGLVLATVHYRAPGALWVRGEAASFEPFHQYLAGLWHHTLRMDGGLLADPVVAALLRLSAFAYLFHYLNWFAKVDLLEWHKLPLRSWVVLLTLYAASLGVYGFGFATGILVANFLSLLHVLLEFPLDWRTLRFVAWGWRGAGAPKAVVVVVAETVA
ncbi:MAG: hypothetical protein V4555_09270 [Acidobacteriota bacterium]